jgi:large repetitive protein
LTPASANGNDWTCSINGQVVNCSYTKPVNASSSTPVITITVNVAQSAGSSLTNTANVSGGGEINTGNNGANDPTTITSSADLSVLKISNNASPAVGENVTFTITLTNAGPSVANNVKLSDALPASLEFVSSNASLGSYDAISGEWNVGSVSVGTHTLTVTAKVLQPRSISNSAEVTASSTPDPDSTTNDGAGDDFSSVTLSGRGSDLTITKTHTGSFTRGSSGAYTITVKNIGDASTQGTANVVDLLPAGLTPSSASGTGWNCSIAGQAVTCSRSDALTAGSSYATITVNVAVGESTANSVTNNASVNGGSEQNTTNSSTNDPTTVVSSADVRVVKTAPDKIVPGTNATFTVQITNDGPSVANDVALNDATPAGLSFVSSSGDCTGAMPCNLGNIASGQTRTVQITYSVPAGYNAPNPVLNTAEISSATSDSDTTNNSSTVAAPVNASSDLQISKVGPVSIVPGTNATFTISIKNDGPSDSNNVNVNDVTPTGLSLIANTGDCITAFPCNLGTIPSGATHTIQATYSVPANYAGANPLINTASVTSSTTDPNLPNTASSSTPIAAKADLSLSKTVSDSTPNIGSNVTFTITLTNNGPSSVSSATIKDQLPAGLQYVSSTASIGTYDAANGNWTISNLGVGIETLTITAKVTGLSAITNTAQVAASSSGDPDSTPNDGVGDDFGTVSLTPQVPDLTVVKSHTGDFTRGTSNNYTVRVINTGTGSTIAPVSITDTLPVGLTPGSANGFGWTCTTTGQTVNCSRNDTLAGSTSYPLIGIPVTVEQNASPSLTNTVSVAGGGDSTTTNNSDNDPTTITSSSDLEVFKTGPAKVVEGNTVTYTITVTNNGPSNATNVNVSDPTPAGLSFISNTGACATAFPCNIGTVAAGSSKTITAKYLVPGNYITGNLGTDPFTNTAHAASDTPDADPSNNKGTSSTALNAPVADLSITKVDFPASSTAIPGASITYKITVTNAGPNVATGARVVDTFPAAITGVTWTCAATGGSSCSNASGTGNINELVTVNVGETITYMATGTIAASATGNLINSATVTPPAGTSDPSGNNDSDTNTLTPQADLDVLKTGPANVLPGTSVVYTITITNKGPSNATDVQVDDPTPAGLTFVSSTGDCTTVFPCNLGMMVPNTSKTITVTYSMPSDFVASNLANTATVSSNTPDPIPGNNFKNSTATVGSSADLSLIKTVDKTAPAVGENVKFTITLTNAGPSNAQNVEVKDLLPIGLQFASSNPSVGSYNTTGGLWTVSSLAPGTATLEVIAKVTRATSITNTAEVSNSDTPDPDSSPTDGKGDDFSSVTIGSTQPDLTIVKTHTGNFIRGGTGSYSLTVTNSGTGATSAAITVTDTLPVGLTPTSASGTGWTCSITGQTVTCSRNDVLAAGASLPVITLYVKVEQGANSTITNTGSVSGGGEDNTANSSSDDPTTIVSSAELSTKKTADKTAANIGEIVNFTITLTNAGPSSASNVVISDLLPAGLELVSNTTSMGAYNSSTGIWTIGNATPGTHTLTINAKVIASGSITNTAKITGSDTPDPDSSNNTSSVTIGAAAPDLTVSKTHTGNFIRGQTGVYRITVKNIGAGATIASVNVSDTLPTGLIPTAASGSGWNCNVTGQVVNCSRSDALNSTNNYAPILITVRVEQTAASSLTNTASVNGGGQVNTTNDSSDDPTTITSSSDLKITKIGPTSITPGLPATYTILVTNLGPSDAKTVTLNDATPTGLSFVSSTGDCITAFPCALGDIPNGASREITVTYDVPADYVTAVLGPDPILNSASLTSNTPDPDPVNSSSTSSSPIAGSADLQITKVGPSTQVIPGTNVSYTLKIKNAGPSDALNVQLDDSTPPGLTFISSTGACTDLPCDLGTLKPGETRNTTVIFAIPSTYLSANLGPDPISNTATVTSDTPDPSVGNSSATAKTSLGSSIADLSITKDDGTLVAIPGAPITYTITVKNAGPSAANGSRVIDTLPSTITNTTWICTASAGSSCSTATGPGDLDTLVNIDVNGTVTFKLSGTVATNATGLLVNSASVTPPANVTDPSSANNTDQDTLTPQANLTITKTGPASITPGSRATYTITVKNEGPSNAANVIVSDPTPAGLIFISSSGNCTTAFPCNVGTVAPNTTKMITVTYDVPANFAGSSITNSASVGSSTPDPTGPNTSSVITPLAGNADLSLSKTVTNSAPLPGTSVTFTIRLSNAGPSDAVNVNVAELLPTGLSLQSSSLSAGAYNASTGAWTISRVPANSNATLTLTVLVTSSGPIKNTAEVISSGTPDSDSTPGNGTIGEDDISSITFGAPVSDLSISKTNGTTSSVAGSLVTYTITVRNAGPDTANGASINDIMPASLSGVTWTCETSAGSSCPAIGTGNIATTVNLPSGGTATFSVTGTLSTTATGALTNTATVMPPSGTNDPNITNNTSTDTDAIGTQADLEISKTGPGTVNKNNLVKYDITVKNNGPSNAAAVIVSDPLPVGLEYVSSNPSQGACSLIAGTVTCNLGTLVNASSATVEIFTKAVGIGRIDNTATVSSDASDLVSNNNSSMASITVGTLSDLTVSKTHEGTFVVDEVGTYSLRVSNIGTDTDPGPITVTDTLPVGLDFVDSSGEGWTCTANGQTVNCKHDGPLAQNSSLPELLIRVKVLPEAFPSITNTASVSSTFGESNTTNNTASDATGVTAPVLKLSKTASSGVIEIGGTLGYTLAMKNTGIIVIDTLELSDNLPLGLVYRANSSTLDGVKISDPQITVENGKQILTWAIPGSLEPSAERSVKFTVIATPQLPDREIKNTAAANGKAGPLSVVVASNVAVANTKTSKGNFNNKGVIVGRVYFDKNDNLSYDEGIDEPLEGARVYLTDGRYAITDSKGRYSLPEIDAGRYAVRLDPLTVPYEPKAVPDDQGLRGTRLVELENGGISTEDFPLEWAQVAIVKARSTQVERGPVSIVKRLEQGGAGYAVSITIKLETAVKNLTITDPLPMGATRGNFQLIASDGQVITVQLEDGKLEDGKLVIPGILAPGEYTLRYAIFTALPPESVVTDPSISYEEVIR